MIGKQRRLARLFDKNSNKTVIVPIDHGVTSGPIEGLECIEKTLQDLISGGVNAIIGHKGILKSNHKILRNTPFILHLSASTKYNEDPNHKVIVNGIENAIELGADAVSIHVNIGSRHESEMLKDFGLISAQCDKHGIPLIAMMYARGRKIKNEKDKEVVKHAARIGYELGADIIKIPYTGDIDSFKEVVESCQIPIIVAGGSKTDDKASLSLVMDAICAGASGVAIGRNAFQRKNVAEYVKAVCDIVHGRSNFDEICAKLKVKNENIDS